MRKAAGGAAVQCSATGSFGARADVDVCSSSLCPDLDIVQYCPASDSHRVDGQLKRAENLAKKYHVSYAVRSFCNVCAATARACFVLAIS